MKLKSGLLSRLSRLGKDQHASGSRLFVRLLRDEAGSYIVYLSLVFPILVGSASLASEGAWWLYVHQTLQNAADSAASSGAAALSKGETNAQITSQANAIASTYCPGQSNTCFVNGANNTTVTVNPSANSVEVIIAQSQSLLFSNIWLSASKTISARAVAIANPTTANCILALGTTGNSATTPPGGIGFTGTINNLNIQMEGCSIFSNSTDSASISFITGNNDTITAFPIGTSGNLSGNNSSFSPTVTTGDPKVPDPYAALAATWPSSCSGSCPTQTVPSCAGQCSAATLSPGVYPVGISLNNSSSSIVTWTFNPGVYYLQGNLNISGQNIKVNGTGVTFVLSGSLSTFLINATNATINVTAPTTGWNAGIAIWEPTSTGSNALASGNSVTGVIYTPNASLSFGNTASPTCTQIVAQQVSLSGNVNLQGNCNLPGMQPAGRAVALVE
jgi:Flp pilus assembly protein TadG